MENVHPEVLRICGEEGFTKLDCFGFVLDSMRIWEGLGRDCNTLVIRFDKPNEPFGNLRAWRRKKYIASNVVLGLQDATPERLDELDAHAKSSPFLAFCFSFEIVARETAADYFKALPNLFDLDAPFDERDVFGMRHRAAVWRDAQPKLMALLDCRSQADERYVDLDWRVGDWQETVRRHLAASDAPFRAMNEREKRAWQIAEIPAMLANSAP